MTGILIITIIVLIIALILRLSLFNGSKQANGPDIGFSQTTGTKEVQADVGDSLRNKAGIMLALADGIGKENTGQVCARVAVDTVMDSFETYHVLSNPEYFFKSVFYEANQRIQKTIEERNGGCSLAVVFITDGFLHYALAGSLRIAVFRNGELIPVSRGQTLDVLAEDAYINGKLSRQETIWSMEEKRLWNYLGKDGFREIEICGNPIRLKREDVLLLATQGICETAAWGEIEDILAGTGSVQEKADHIVRMAEETQYQDRENGSVLLLAIHTEAADEKD